MWGDLPARRLVRRNFSEDGSLKDEDGSLRSRLVVRSTHLQIVHKRNNYRPVKFIRLHAPGRLQNIFPCPPKYNVGGSHILLKTIIQEMIYF